MFKFVSAVAAGAMATVKVKVKTEMALCIGTRVAKKTDVRTMPVREYMTAPVLAMVIARAVWHLGKGGKDQNMNVIRSGGNDALNGLNAEYIKDVEAISTALHPENYQQRLNEYTLKSPEHMEEGTSGVRGERERSERRERGGGRESAGRRG